MILQILQKSITKIPKLYLLVLPLTILKLIPYEWNNEMQLISYLLISILILVSFFAGYYQNYLSLQSYKKNIKLKSIKKNFLKKLKRWFLASMLVLWKVAKWFIPIIISFGLSTELFSSEYHVATNLIGVGLLFLGTYMTYKLILVIIAYSMTGLIAIEKSKSTQEILEESEKITSNRKMFLIKLGLITSAITALVSMFSFKIIFTQILGLEQVTEINSSNIIGFIIYILIDNIITALSVNVHGQAYKTIK